MPEQKKKGDNTGMQTEVAAALGVNRNRATSRERVALRAEIDKLAVAHSKELKVGDAVVCKRTPSGATSTLKSLHAGLKGKCTVQINMNGRVFDRHFSSLGSGRGGGFVRRPAIEFSPPARKQRKDAVPESVRRHIHEH